MTRDNRAEADASIVRVTRRDGRVVEQPAYTEAQLARIARDSRRMAKKTERKLSGGATVVGRTWTEQVRAANQAGRNALGSDKDGNRRGVLRRPDPT